MSKPPFRNQPVWASIVATVLAMVTIHILDKTVFQAQSPQKPVTSFSTPPPSPTYKATMKVYRQGSEVMLHVHVLQGNPFRFAVWTEEGGKYVPFNGSNPLDVSLTKLGAVNKGWVGVSSIQLNNSNGFWISHHDIKVEKGDYSKAFVFDGGSFYAKNKSVNLNADNKGVIWVE